MLSEILPAGGFNGYRSPALSPDHSRLAFSCAERGTQQIYSSQLNGDDRKQLTESTGLFCVSTFATASLPAPVLA